MTPGAQPPALTVGFDGRALVSPAGGVRRYARELLAAFGDADPSLSLVVVGHEARVPVPPGVRTQPASGSLPTNLGWALSGAPMSARRARVDVFHAPAYTAPLWGVHPLVLTIHDVSYARHPEWYPYRRDWLRRAFYRRSALTADLVITDSEFSAREIQAAYGIAPDRIRVVPLGVGPPFTSPHVPKPGDTAGARGPFVLHVGDIHVRRNLTAALSAVCDLRRTVTGMENLQLVLAGRDAGACADLRRQAGEAGQAAALRHVASPDDAELVTLYRSAALLVYPSRYEGFGLPLLEAMACGCPVVGAAAGSIPEVVGEAAVLVAPDDVRGLREAMLAVLSDQTRRRAMRVRSIERAATFTWTATAAATARVYREAAALG